MKYCLLPSIVLFPANMRYRNVGKSPVANTHLETDNFPFRKELRKLFLTNCYQNCVRDQSVRDKEDLFHG